MEPDLSDVESTNVSDTKDEDIVSHHESEEEPSDSESREGSTSSPQTSPRAGRDSPGSRRNRTNRISYSDFSYLNALSRQERRRIEDEMIKGHKLALTVNNIVQELRGVNLFYVDDDDNHILRIPPDKLAELRSAHHSTDEREAAVVREFLLRDPLASWRRIIYQLDEWARYYSEYHHYSDVADRIRHYAEELTDTTLTHSNLSTVLNHVVDIEKLMDCLNIPPSVRDKIRGHSSNYKQQRDESILYYLKFSPYSMWGWGYLGGELHYWGEEDALTAAKAYIQRAPEPSLTLDNLTSVLDGVQNLDGSGFNVADWLQIPSSKRDELRGQYERRQRPRAYSTYYLTQNPSPSWSIVAWALWQMREHGALDVVQKLYLKGSSESRRLFELSMKRGYVDMYTDKMLLYGSAGVGKTCIMKIVAGEKPPDIRNSTPIATRPVTMYQLQMMRGKWRKYVSKDRMTLCTRISKTTLGREIIEALVKQQEEAIRQAPSQEVEMGEGGEQTSSTMTTENRQQPVATRTTRTKIQGISTPSSQPSATSTPSSVDPDVLQVIHDVLDEMFQLIDECPETEEPLTFIHKLLVSDCGGQPQFHEVLPIFLRRMSLIMFVFKLSEDLSSRPMIEYYEDGKPLGTPYESHHTTEQLIKQGLQSLHTHWSSKEDGRDGEAPQIVMIGTHKDKEKEGGESREMKDEKLREMLLPTFKKEIIYYQPGINKVLFPMNAQCPGKEEEDMAQAVISRFSTENRSDKRQLPLQWLGFEIMLEEITQRLERGILSRSECLEIAYRLHLDESALDAALIYLDELSLVFYYPDILPEVVFTNPQVLLDKISELVKVHHDKLMMCTGDDWQDFFSHALVTVKFLQQPKFKKHYVACLFEPQQLATLYRKLLIFADFSDEGIYFVPSLLRMLSSKEVDNHRLSLKALVAPLVLLFPDGPPRRGIFCALISFLTSPENHYPGPWKLKKPARSVTPARLHRNCIQFLVPGFKTACSITLVDTLLHFEVHFNLKSQELTSKFCPVVKQAISAGLRKANVILGYTNSTPSFAFLCPCGEGDPHPATVGDRGWICTLDGDVGEQFTPNQLVWSKEENTTEAIGDSSSASKEGVLGQESQSITSNRQTNETDHQETVATSDESQPGVQSGRDSSTSVSKRNGRKLDNNGHNSPASHLNTAQGDTKAESRISLDEVATEAGISNLDIFDQECSQTMLLKLAKHCVDWRLIGLYLDLIKSDITAVDEDYRTTDEKRAGMLERWKEKFAFKAKYGVLIEALLACGKTQDAVDACKTIAKGIAAVTSLCGKEQLSKAFKLLLPLASEWENIGLCLGLDNFEESVKASAKTAPSCLRETLKLWLSRAEPPPTWKELADAVEPFDSEKAAKIK